MARNKYSRRMFPLKAYVVSKERPNPKVHYEEMPNLNIGKIQLPSIGYVHIRFKDIVELISNKPIRKLFICVGAYIDNPNRYYDFKPKHNKHNAMELSDLIDQHEGFHEAKYEVQQISKNHPEYSFNELWNHWYELVLMGEPKSMTTVPIVPNTFRKIESDSEPKLSQIETRINFNFKYRYYYCRKICGDNHSYILPMSLSDQIYYYINKCLTDYIKRHYKRNIRHVDQH